MKSKERIRNSEIEINPKLYQTYYREYYDGYSFYWSQYMQKKETRVASKTYKDDLTHEYIKKGEKYIYISLTDRKDFKERKIFHLKLDTDKNIIKCLIKDWHIALPVYEKKTLGFFNLGV